MYLHVSWAPIVGHQGRERTHDQIKRRFYWPKMASDVADFVASCDQCQWNEVADGKPSGLSATFAGA